MRNEMVRLTLLRFCTREATRLDVNYLRLGLYVAFMHANLARAVRSGLARLPQVEVTLQAEQRMHESDIVLYAGRAVERQWSAQECLECRWHTNSSSMETLP